MATIDFVATNKKAARFREDASFVYRCENLALGLEAIGTKTRLDHLANYSPSLDTRAVVLHRPKFTPRLVWLVGRLRLAGIPILADIDDLIIDPTFATASPAARNGALPLHKIVKQFKSHNRALQLVDLISVSTAPLVDHIARLFPGKATALLHNAVHARWLPMAERMWTKTSPREILYMPGTKSHDRDFQGVVPALSRFLGEHSEISLNITGHLSADRTSDLERRLVEQYGGSRSQIRHSPKVPFDSFAERFAEGWINLSPLEASPFNDCKSALKVIEAGFWNIPTLCSPNPDTDRFADAGAIVADGEEAWFQALTRLLDDGYYNKQSQGLRQRTMANASVQQSAESLLDAIDRLRPGTSILGLVPTQVPWQPTKLALLRAKAHRREGRYDEGTLALYRRAWQESPTPEHLLAYLSFRRDLGHAVSEEKADTLLGEIAGFGTAGQHKAANLIAESGKAAALSQVLSASALQTLADNSPAIACAHPDLESNPSSGLANFCASQALWREEFASCLHSTLTNICIVGNAASLVGSTLGEQIDEHGLVVRFNHYRSDSTKEQDIGKRTDVWVRAPNLGPLRPERFPPHWVVLSGADPIYQLREWSAVKRILRDNSQALTVPLPVWRELVAELKAPPSAGVLFLAWAIKLLGCPSAVTAAGFQLHEAAAPGERYHQALRDHKGSTRHHWPAERALLRRWQAQGMNVLGA